MYLFIKLSTALVQGQSFPEEVRRAYGLQSTPIRCRPKRRGRGQRHPGDPYQKNLLLENEAIVNDRRVENVDSARRVADELAQTGVPQETVALVEEQTLDRG
jgi:hypothetical protein